MGFKITQGKANKVERIMRWRDGGPAAHGPTADVTKSLNKTASCSDPFSKCLIPPVRSNWIAGGWCGRGRRMDLGGVLLKVIDLIFCKEKFGASWHVLQQILLRGKPL